MVTAENIGHRTAIRDNVALKAPITPQVFLEQNGIRTRWRAVQRVVGTHHGLGFAFHDRRPKRGQIGVLHVMPGGLNVNGVSGGLWTAMHREVFRSGNRFQIDGFVPLQAGDEGNAETPGQVGVLAIGFLAASPARIAEDIDIGGPNRKTAVPVGGTIGMHRGVILGAEFRANDLADLVHQRLVESGSHANRLRKHGRVSGASDTVQALVPPVVLRDTEPRYGARRVAKLRDFLLQRHLRHQVADALLDGQLGIQIGRFSGRLLRRRCWTNRGAEQYRD